MKLSRKMLKEIILQELEDSRVRTYRDKIEDINKLIADMEKEKEKISDRIEALRDTRTIQQNQIRTISQQQVAKNKTLKSK